MNASLQFIARISPILLVLLLLVGVAANASDQRDNGEAAIYRVHYDELADITPLLEFDLWQDRITPDSIAVYMTPEQLEQAEALPVRIELDASQTASLNVSRDFQDTSTIPGYACYRTVEETYADLSTLAAANPTLVQELDIGDSYDKVTSGGTAGYDIKAWVIGNQSSGAPTPRPVYHLISAAHAREYATAELVTRFSERMVNLYGIDPDVTWLLDYYDLHIIPQANPDGRKIAEVGISWRKNRNPAGCGSNASFGVDLNRNLSYQWGINSGSSANACNSLYRGLSPNSEPETVAFKEYVDGIFPDQRANDLTTPAPITTTGLFLSIHSYFPGILPAFGYTDYEDTPNFPGLNALGQKMGYYNNYRTFGTNAGIGAASGTHDDYVYGEFGVPSYTYEIGTSFFQSCSSFESTVYPDNRDALLYGYKQTRIPYTNATGPDVGSIVATSNGVSGATGAITVSQGAIVTITATVDDTQYHSDSWYASNQTGLDLNIPTNTISSTQLSIGAPSWDSPSATVAMSATDGSFDASAESVIATVDTSNLAPGRHIIFIEAVDSGGTPGVPTAYFINVLSVATRIYLPIIEASSGVSSAEIIVPGFFILATATARLLPDQLHRGL